MPNNQTDPNQEPNQISNDELEAVSGGNCCGYGDVTKDFAGGVKGDVKDFISGVKGDAKDLVSGICNPDEPC